MILSASRRTDIPCFYADWFINRLRAGYALTRNPWRPHEVYRIPLNPQTVDCIVFWTKDPAPLLPRLREIEEMGYSYCFQFTLTGYGRDLEAGLRPKEEILRTFLELSRRVGLARIQWRYDPILLWGEWDIQRHIRCFSALCERLAAHTRGVTISFLDVYRRLRAAGFRELTQAEMEALGEGIGQAAGRYGLPVSTCCETVDLSRFHIAKGACIGRDMLEAACGCALEIPKDKNQRPGCGCLSSVDIGAYSTCANGCMYCYASDGPAAVRQRRALHRPDGPLLYGDLGAADTIRERAFSSFRTGQIRLG